MKSSALRTRWAAVGAAVAVSLGAGGVGISQATTSSGEKPVFIPLDSPCRLADTRPAPDTIGPRTTGIGPDETYTLDGWGTEGDCTLPSDTAGLALNVTAVGATEQTNLRFFPEGATVPDTANLNPTPGAPPIPNAVNVNLNDANGQFSVFNKFGDVAVVIDVMGYYDDHNHDDRYYTEEEVDTAITAANGVAWANDDVAANLNPTTPTLLLTLPIETSVDGYVVVDAMANILMSPGISVVCWIAIDTEAESGGHGIQYVGAGTVAEWNDAKGFEITAGAHELNLLCRQDNGVADDATVQVRNMTAVFAATSLAPAPAPT